MTGKPEDRCFYCGSRKTSIKVRSFEWTRAACDDHRDLLERQKKIDLTEYERGTIKTEYDLASGPAPDGRTDRA
jgi:hypothetical protein